MEHTTIADGSYKAVIVHEGAGLAKLEKDGRNLVVPHALDFRPTITFQGKVLVPWPNRIRNATYDYRGTSYKLVMNEPERNSALHGLKLWDVWEQIGSSANQVTLRATTGPTSGYPFRLRTTVTYRLDAKRGLFITIETTNIGDNDAPYGTGTHSYLTCDGQLANDCVLTVPADQVLTVDNDLAPLAKENVQNEGLDYRQGELIGETQIDHAFTALPEGQWTVTLKAPDTGMSVSLESDEPWVQIFSGDNMNRAGVAVEPMTCPPNAFNSGEDLILLKPHDTHTHQLRIEETTAPTSR